MNSLKLPFSVKISVIYLTPRSNNLLKKNNLIIYLNKIIVPYGLRYYFLHFYRVVIFVEGPSYQNIAPKSIYMKRYCIMTLKITLKNKLFSVRVHLLLKTFFPHSVILIIQNPFDPGEFQCTAETFDVGHS